MNIPKSILKKLNLRKEEDIKIEAKELEETKAIENTERFMASMDVIRSNCYSSLCIVMVQLSF